MTSFLQELERGIANVNQVAAQSQRLIANGMRPELAERVVRDDARQRKLERDLRQAWADFREYNSVREALEVVGVEERDVEVAAVIYSTAETLR